MSPRPLLVTALAEVRRRRRLPDPLLRKHLRVQAGLTQADIGRAVGVSASAVARWEGGSRSPCGRELWVYLEVLDELVEEAP